MGNTILFLIDAWSSVAGGIQTVNRELCLALTSYCKESDGEQIEVVCICKDCSQVEQEDAKRGGVALVKADIVESAAGGDDRILANLFHSSMGTTDVICVVGHAKFTGRAARNVRDKYFPSAKVVTTYQMDPDETEVFKEDFEAASGPEFSRFVKEWEERAKIEVEIASRADIVFGIGPRLERSIKTALAARVGTRPKIQLLLCGVRENVLPRDSCPEKPTFVFIGRVEHPKVKGVDLFAGAAGELVKRWSREWRDLGYPEPRFMIRGFPADGVKAKAIFEELKSKAESIAGRSVDILPRAFSTEESSLVQDILSASAVVMPSRAEGFGLVALEAVSYGVPIVVAKDSGVAEMLEKYCYKAGYEPVYIVDTRGLGNEPVERLAKALAYFVQVPERVKLVGKDLRQTLVEVCSWRAAAKSFMEAALGIAVPLPAHPRPEEISEVLDLMRKEAGYVDDECRRTSGRPLDEIFVGRDFQEWQPFVMEESVGKLESLGLELPKPHHKGKSKKWSDVIDGLGAAVILGDPGSGKTVCLLREVHQRCLAAVTSLESGAHPLEEITFAAYFHASQLSGSLVGTGRSVIDSAVDLLCERHGLISDGCRAWLHHKFKNGQVLLAVDALDEVPRGAGEE